MGMVRQSVLIRTDLGFNIGLMAAQVAHTHFENFRKKLLSLIASEKDPKSTFTKDDIEWLLTKDDREWLGTPYLFIHGVSNKESLEYFIKKASEVGVECEKWYDTVYVKVSEKQQLTLPDILVGISLGPAESDKIREVIGDLPLLG